MFTGLVTATGVVRRGLEGRRSGTLEIDAPGLVRSLQVGASVAVNGCCLTVTRRRRHSFLTDLSSETVKRTNLGGLRKGASVNLELPLRLSDRLGGHWVQGHVDGQGEVLSVHRNGSALRMEVGFPKRLRRYMIPKGSVAIDGVSMTVNRLKPDRLTLFIIPETLRRTTLGGRRRGDRLNLEVDLVGKYIASFLAD